MRTVVAAPGAEPSASPRVRHARRAGTIVVLTIGLLLAVGISLGVGAQPVAPADLLAGLAGRGEAPGIAAARLDRTVLAVVVGACLALAGATLQGVTRNPLADPGVLGLTGGAALAVVLGTYLLGPLSASTTGLLALVGVLGAAVVVLTALAVTPPERQVLTTVLAGAAVLAASNSVVAGVLVSDTAALDRLRFWQVGSVGGRDAGAVTALLPMLVLGLLLVLASIRALDALALGDDLATALGQQVLTGRAFAVAGASLLVAVATALAGPVAFVGLIVPHVVRRFTGPGAGTVSLGCVLAGPILVLLADTLGRVIMPPSEIQVGILTALLGVPVLVAVIRRTVGP